MPVIEKPARDRDIAPEILSVAIFRPGPEPDHEFVGTWDGRHVSLVVYDKATWDSIPDDQRPPGTLSRGGDAVLCVIERAVT